MSKDVLSHHIAALDLLDFTFHWCDAFTCCVGSFVRCSCVQLYPHHLYAWFLFQISFLPFDLKCYLSSNYCYFVKLLLHFLFECWCESYCIIEIKKKKIHWNSKMMLLMQTITMTIIFSFIRIFNCLFNKEQSENVLWVFVFNRLLSFTPLQLGCQNYICWFFDCSKFNLFLIFFFLNYKKKEQKHHWYVYQLIKYF